jgi:tetratricopeptide (TPR) repeat protein
MKNSKFLKYLAITSVITIGSTLLQADEYNNEKMMNAHKNGDYKSALNFGLKSLEVDLMTFNNDRNHPELAENYNNIGALYADLKQYKKALYFYHKALSINKATWGTEDPAVAKNYSNIGGVYYKMGNLHKALRYATLALNIRKTWGDSNAYHIESQNDVNLIKKRLATASK